MWQNRPILTLLLRPAHFHGQRVGLVDDDDVSWTFPSFFRVRRRSPLFCFSLMDGGTTTTPGDRTTAFSRSDGGLDLGWDAAGSGLDGLSTTLDRGVAFRRSAAACRSVTRSATVNSRG